MHCLPALLTAAALLGAPSFELGYESRHIAPSAGADAFFPYDVNDLGVVSGQLWFFANNSGHAAYWDASGMHDIGVPDGYWTTTALGINNQGHMAVSASDEQFFTSRGFRYDGTSLQDVGSLGGQFVGVGGINESGQIVGGSTRADEFYFHAFLQDSSGIHELFPNEVDHSSQGNFITDTGHVAGYFGPDLDDFLLIDGEFLVPRLLNPGVVVHIQGLNSDGVAVGSVHYGGDLVHAAIFIDGVYEDLNGLVENYPITLFAANYINDHGVIIATNVRGEHVVIENGKVTPLIELFGPDSGWSNVFATNLSDEGHIIGTGNFNGAESQAFILSPVVVPEPASIMLALSFAALLGARASARSLTSATSGG